MAIKIGHASVGENGKAIGGAAGDQTGREVCVRTWYNGKWDCVLRPKNPQVAEKSAIFVEQACVNDNVGYDQSGRNTLFAQAAAVNFDSSKIKVKCECDCSSLIHVAVIAAGANITYGSNGFTTRTMADRLVASGDYEKITDSKYLTSDKHLKRGDILVKAGSHTVMTLENGSGVTTSTSQSTSTYTGNSIVDYLNSIGKDSSFTARKQYAAQYGISNYTGTAEQNSKLLNLMRSSNTTSTSTTTVKYFKKYTGTSGSIVTALNSIGATSTYTYRCSIAKANNINGYTGTAKQNTDMLNLLKQGKLIQP